MKTPAGHKVYAMAAEYPSAAALYEAAKRVRDAGFQTVGRLFSISHSWNG
jgi:hypothetical protein